MFEGRELANEIDLIVQILNLPANALSPNVEQKEGQQNNNELNSERQWI